MDVHLAVTSKRDARGYTGGRSPTDVARRILDAGRLAGSARNRQPTRFLVAEGDGGARGGRAVYGPGNVLGAGLSVVLVVSPGGGLVDFDAGRAAQNMMLAAWAEGVASCPNGVADPDGLARAPRDRRRPSARWS